jgi:hypothetical protein
MTDKRHYQTAASEVRAGKVDQALWIKVNVEYPGESSINKQAQYIRLRAVELSRQTNKDNLLRFAPRKWWHWILYFAASFVLANIISGLSSLFSNDFAFAIFFPTWFALIAAVVTLGVRRHRADSYATSSRDLL